MNTMVTSLPYKAFVNTDGEGIVNHNIIMSLAGQAKLGALRTHRNIMHLMVYRRAVETVEHDHSDVYSADQHHCVPKRILL